MKNNKLMKGIIIAVVMLIPIIYSFFYLKSYWDPYGDLTGMKIAIVNLDAGIDEENQGKEFVNGLKESGIFDICEVSEEDAKNGMTKGEYYAVITVPSNFTKSLNSAAESNKQIAKITYAPNQASNYLATQIINSAVKTMELNLEEKIDSKIVETLADKLQEVPESLQDISDGANQILEGSQSLNSGLDKINTGANTLSSSYVEFDKGVNSAYDGSKQIDGGLSQVGSGIKTLSQGANSLDDAITQINAGISQLNTQGAAGITTLTSGFSSLSQGAKQVSDGVNSIGTSINNSLTQSQNDLLTSAGVASIDGLNGAITIYNSKIIDAAVAVNTASVDTSSSTYIAAKTQYDTLIGTIAKLNQAKGAYEALEQVKTSINTNVTSGNLYALSVGAKQVSDGAALLASQDTMASLEALTQGLNSLKVALEQVKAGTSSLTDGVSTLENGATVLQAGSKTLTSGLAKLNESSKLVKTSLETLSDGTNAAYEGSSALLSGVQTFKNEIDKGLNDTKEQLKDLDGIEEFAENPVVFETEPYGEVSSYGIAFTPLFICIGLWVGALMDYVVLYFDQKNRFEVLGSIGKNKILQNMIYIAIGAFQGIITAALLKLGLGYSIENIVLYYMVSALIGITFISIIQFLIRNFGDVGKFIALIILVLQLAASGGTFPVETINKAFQAISPYLPMTYSINLLREVMVPTATNYAGMYIVILIAITIITVAITNAVDIMKKKKVEEK